VNENAMNNTCCHRKKVWEVDNEEKWEYTVDIEAHIHYW